MFCAFSLHERSCVRVKSTHASLPGRVGNLCCKCFGRSPCGSETVSGGRGTVGGRFRGSQTDRFLFSCFKWRSALPPGRYLTWVSMGPHHKLTGKYGDSDAVRCLKSLTWEIPLLILCVCHQLPHYASLAAIREQIRQKPPLFTQIHNWKVNIRIWVPVPVSFQPLTLTFMLGPLLVTCCLIDSSPARLIGFGCTCEGGTAHACWGTHTFMGFVDLSCLRVISQTEWKQLSGRAGPRNLIWCDEAVAQLYIIKPLSPSSGWIYTLNVKDNANWGDKVTAGSLWRLN